MPCWPGVAHELLHCDTVVFLRTLIVVNTNIVITLVTCIPVGNTLVINLAMHCAIVSAVAEHSFTCQDDTEPLRELKSRGLPKPRLRQRKGANYVTSAR